MKKLFAYFKHPIESIAKEDSASIGSIILFYFLIQGLFILSVIPFVIAGILPENEISNLKELGLPFWVIAFIPPILEELAFRFSLKRRRINFIVSFVVVCWFLLPKIIPVFPNLIYSPQYFWLRLSISVVLGLLLGYFLTPVLQKIRFEVVFYVFAFLFGFLHIFNYAIQITSLIFVLYILIYLLNKVVIGMLLGYIRVRYTIFGSIVVHLLNNFIPLLLVYYVS